MAFSNRKKINRANAQFSTGPTSHEGKKKSSLNALRHGLTGQIVVMPTEDLGAYQRHVESFVAEYNPHGPTEAHLVQSLADTCWRLNRAAALETNVMTLGVASPSRPSIDAPPQIQDTLSIAAALESQSKALANLSMHSQRLSRQFERAVTQLRDLQKQRCQQEKEELDNLVSIIQMHEDRGERFDPTAHGFVFSEPQIKLGIEARHRHRLADQAYHHNLATA